MPRYAIGFDFGNESVRVVIIDIRTAHLAAQAVDHYAHGVLERTLPTGGQSLPPEYALQHPQDWLESGGRACREAMRAAHVPPGDVIGIGVAFTSCTMLPCRSDGTPLCLLDRFAPIPLAWPKLGKHRAAKSEADHINQIARERNEPWLARYGGTIAVEWFFPKMLETIAHAPEVADATEVWLEAGDWIVWQLIDGPFPRCRVDRVVRSICQAGYHACYHERYPSDDFFAAVNPALARAVASGLPGVHLSPGRQAGVLAAPAAQLLGLRPGIAVSTATTHIHATVPGAGVASPSTLVLIMGNSVRHLLNSRIEATPPRLIGVVKDGILPGYFGYETEQEGVGDALAWCARNYNMSEDELSSRAATIAPGSGGATTLEWLEGRHELVDRIRQMSPEQVYRMIIEATAFELRWICETLREAGVPVRRFVASGELAGRSPLLMQVYADVLDARIKPSASAQPPAVGAAILGCLAAGSDLTGFASMSQAIHAMAPKRRDLLYRPDLAARKAYDKLYEVYRAAVADPRQTVVALRRLREPGGN